MTRDQLIGEVAVAFLQQGLDSGGEEGVARYLLDCLTAEQTAAVARAILSHRDLASRIEIRLPVHFVGHLGLPETVLTTERATYFRNADCSKEAILVATTGDDERFSLRELMPVGTLQLLQCPEFWVERAGSGLGLPDADVNAWSQCLKGLLQSRAFPLEKVADFVLATAHQVGTEGEPLLSAIGMSLPTLRIPLDSTLFTVLTGKTMGHASRWKQLFTKAISRRACYLLKQTPTQSLLTTEVLRDTFEKVRESIPVEYHDTVRGFIEAPGGWNLEAKELALCEWEHISPLFDGLQRERFNLGERTLQFFRESHPDRLGGSEEEYLEGLAKRNYTSPEEEDTAFYEGHREDLKEDTALKGKWDRFIFGSPAECEDFLAGLIACLEVFFDRLTSDQLSRSLRIRCDKRTIGDLKKLNYEVGLYFCLRYRSLPSLFPAITWDLGTLFDYEKLYDSWRNDRKARINRSTARAALCIKFYLDFQMVHPTGAEESFSKQLVWRFSPSGVPSELPGDLGRLASNPFTRCFASREPIGAKGNLQPVDLRDASTLHPCFAQDRGSLVPTYRKEHDLSLEWQRNLVDAQRNSLVSDEANQALLAAWQQFAESYEAAIRALCHDGYSPELRSAALAYGMLLDLVKRHTPGDRARRLLLRPLLALGCAPIAGEKTTAIVAPWHPLRMLAQQSKMEQVSRLIGLLLSAEPVAFSDARLFFRDVREALESPYYPEVVAGWQGEQPELLGWTDHFLDYSLHENPVATHEGNDDTNENPVDAANLVLELVERYLRLYPHERANFSAVLYNCDSARLPQAVVEKISGLRDGEDDLRCQVVLRHRESRKLADLYERLIEGTDEGGEAYAGSEVSTDFMARLRIAIMADQAPAPGIDEGRPTDLVFLHDVIARHARLKWYPVTVDPVDASDLRPTEWSRQRPAALDDMKSVAYLVCPVQTSTGWQYLSALSSFFESRYQTAGMCLLPARELDFHEEATRAIFDEAHGLGNWVVNYDELLDRRQLINQGVRVIRYKQTRSQGRNVLVSSKAPLGLLKSMVRQRISALNLSLDQGQLERLTTRFIDDANSVSGDLVLRAAKRGRNASELMGVVLSRFLVAAEIGPNQICGWYFLDDYAEWLGQKEERIADLLALHLSREGDEYQIGVIVTEAKYVDYAGLAAKRKESEKQLRDTVRRVRHALFSEPSCMDRPMWVARLSNLISSGIHLPAGSNVSTNDWSKALRDGQCRIYVRGYSHVFVSGPSDCPDCSESVALRDVEDSFQEVFSRSAVQQLARSYLAQGDPRPVRLDISDGMDRLEKTYLSMSSENARRRTTDQPDPVSTLTEPGRDERSPAAADTNPRVPPDPEVPLPSREQSIREASVPQGECPGTDDTGDGWLEEKAVQCRNALQQFRLRAKLLEKKLTPNCALLKFQGSSELTVDQVARRKQEFLTSYGLEVVSINPEPGMVAISIARPQRQIVRLCDAWDRWDMSSAGAKCELLLGVKEEDGGLLCLSPRRNAPHTLIAGTTGSGKSVLMQNIILSIAATNRPSDAQLILIDPKRVGFAKFRELPHLWRNRIVTQKDEAAEVLSWLVEEMDRRYDILEQNAVEDIYELKRAGEAPGSDLPFLWVIHDEFALWMIDKEYSDLVEGVVSKLAIAARAAGIFLVFAAQRPDKDVLPMQLRANLGNRLVLKVDTAANSEIALGEKNLGAEKLLGGGHMIARLEGEYGVIYTQVPYANSETIQKITAAIGCAELGHPTE